MAQAAAQWAMTETIFGRFKCRIIGMNQRRGRAADLVIETGRHI
jgi:hypothetical protein